MKYWKRRNLEDRIYRFLLILISEDYIGDIMDIILDDVIRDISECANEDWNDDDIRFALGRVLCEKLRVGETA